MPSAHTRKGRSKSGPPFIQVPWFILDCPAWQHLTPAARSVWLTLGRRYNGFNNGTLGLSVRDAAAECRINKDTASAALATLADIGFVECVVPGGFSRKARHAAEWRLTHLRCDLTGAPPTKAFVRWRPPPPETKTRSGTSADTVPSFGTVIPMRHRKAK